MARVPLPERGQPLDVSYIYSLAQAINDIAVSVSDGSNHTSKINGQILKTSNARFVAITQQVSSGEEAKAGDIKTGDYTFESAFKYPPVVTISPVNVGMNDEGANVTVSVKEVTTSKVIYSVRYNSTGTVSMSVNIIAIGVPN
jgi:hypothetical protein